MATPLHATDRKKGHPPIALTIAGSDSGGGAGIQADLKTFTAYGVHGASVVTALTAQNSAQVSDVWHPPPESIEAQFNAVSEGLDIDAAKIGMLGSKAAVEALATALERHPLPHLVVDPVLIASSGHPLLDPDAIAPFSSSESFAKPL